MMQALQSGVHDALQNIVAHKLRSGLTIVGVAIGIAAVITSVSVGDGVRHQISQQLRSLGANLLLVMPGTRKRDGIVLQSGSRLSITREDADVIRTQSPYVKAVGAFISGKVRVVAGNRNWLPVVAGVTPGYVKAREWSVASGQPLVPAQYSKAEKVVLLGQTVARRLFGSEQAVGRIIRFRNAPFLVVGILERKGQSADGRDQDNLILMPLSAARSRVFGRNPVKPSAVQGILIKVADGIDQKRAVTDIRRRLRFQHRLTADQKDDFRIRDLTQLARARKNAIGQFILMIGIIASVSLLVGGIGIMNVQMVSVSERMREIGVRLAVGASPGDIRAQFLTESVALAGIGGLLGIVSGALMAGLVTHWIGWVTHISALTVAIAILFSALVGVGFGLYPAIKAGRLEPAQYLKTE